MHFLSARSGVRPEGLHFWGAPTRPRQQSCKALGTGHDPQSRTLAVTITVLASPSQSLCPAKCIELRAVSWQPPSPWELLANGQTEEPQIWSKHEQATPVNSLHLLLTA